MSNRGGELDQSTLYAWNFIPYMYENITMKPLRAINKH
jgi:hypothetical protein